jgi:hypothetical protein
MNSLGFIALGIALTGTYAAADEGRLLDDETFSYRPHHCAVYDAGFVLAAPTALPTGLARGVAAGVTVGKTFAWGVRASYASASEDGEAWAATHREVRALATGSVQHVLGRGVLGLRAGLGGTFVHEHRMRHQGGRAGLEGDELEATNLALLPTATLDATLGLHVRGAWMLQLSAGPSVSLIDGETRGAWSAALGVAWHP